MKNPHNQNEVSRLNASSRNGGSEGYRKFTCWMISSGNVPPDAMAFITLCFKNYSKTVNFIKHL